MRVLHSAGLAASRHDSFAHGFGDWWCRDAQHLNEELLMNKLEGGDKEIFFIMHEIDSIFEGIHYSRSLSRSRLEELCMDYFRIPWASW